jgi:transposase-like protein
MGKGLKHPDELRARCEEAMRCGVSMQDISLVEGVALATLYKWRTQRVELLPRTELEQLRAENDKLRRLVAKLLET